MFVARADGNDLARGVVQLAVDEPKPLWPLVCYVELDSGKLAQVTTDVPVAELLADDASMSKIVGDGSCGCHDVSADRSQVCDIGDDFGTRDQRVSGRGGVAVSRRLTSRCLGRLAQRLIKVATGQ